MRAFDALLKMFPLPVASLDLASQTGVSYPSIRQTVNDLRKRLVGTGFSVVTSAQGYRLADERPTGRQ